MLELNEKIQTRLIGMNYEPFSFSVSNYRTCSFDLNYDNYKIVFVLDGEIEFTTLKYTNTLKSGMFAVINPNKVYSIDVKSKDNLILTLEMDNDLFFDKKVNSFNILLINKDDVYRREYSDIVFLIKNLICDYLISTEISLNIFMRTLNKIVELLKSFFTVGFFSNDRGSDEWVEEQIIKLTKKMFENLDDSYTLGKIADLFKTHSSKISKLYTEIFGFGFSDVYHFAQLKKSVELLLKTDNNILEIALLCGFTNAKPFYENYQKYMGCTPMVFRKKFTEILEKPTKYSTLDSVLNSESFKQILADYNFFNLNSKNISSKNERIYDVPTQIKSKPFENYSTVIISKDMLGKRWVQALNAISNKIKFEHVTFQIRVDDEHLYMKNELSVWEVAEKDMIVELIHSLLNIDFEPIIMFEVQKFNKKRGNRKMYYKRAFELLKYYINFIRNIVPVSVLENWRFEVDMSHITKRCADTEYLTDFYHHTYDYISSELPLSKLGLHMEEIDFELFSNEKSSFFELFTKIKRPKFLSFKMIDSYLYSGRKEKIFSKDRLWELLKQVDEFREFFYEKFSYKPNIYISTLYIYYDWDTIPKEYWGSVMALSSVKGFLMGQKYNNVVSSIIYYGKTFNSKEEFYENICDFSMKYDYVNSFGIKNMNYYFLENMIRMGKECIYQKEGLIVTKHLHDYHCLVYQDMATCIQHLLSTNQNKEVFKSRLHTIKLNGLYGKYKIITKKICSKDGTWYNEWRKMGAPEYMSDEEKEYLESKVKPTLEIEFVEMFGNFERTVDLDLFEMAFIEIKKLYL